MNQPIVDIVKASVRQHYDSKPMINPSQSAISLNGGKSTGNTVYRVVKA